jgi:hypothetical protein
VTYLGKKVYPGMTKLGEFDGFSITHLLNLLVEKFPGCEFVIGEGRSYDWFSLYSSSDTEIIRNTVDEFVQNKSIGIKVDDDSMEKSSPRTVHERP